MTKLLESEYEVAIIGLGPVGATLAGLLGANGIKVLGIDAAADIYDQPRAIGMDQEVMRVFQHLGVTDDLAPFISEYKPSEYQTATGEVIRRFESRAKPYPLGWPPYLTFLQPDLEKVLRANAVRHDNVTLQVNRELIDLHSNGQINTLTVQDCQSNDVTTTTARFVVGCDGGSSFVRKHHDIVFEDLIFDEPWLVIDMLVEEGVDLPDTNIQFCDPQRPHTFVVGPGKLRRWEFMLRPGESATEMTKEETIWSLISPWIKPGQATLWRAATYQFHALVAEQWRKDNTFLAGDACHMTPPFLAQGMVQGVKDAVNLAWKLDAVLKGAPLMLLDSYEEERRPLVREVISITKGLGRIICETDPVKAEARNAIMRQEMADGNGVVLRQDLFPPIAVGELCLDLGNKSTAAGRPAPQPRVKSATGWQLLDDVVEHGYALLSLPTLELTPEIRAHAEKIGVTVCVIGDGENLAFCEEHSVFAEWMAEHKANAILTRPDHMVFAACCDLADITQAFDSVTPFVA